MRKCILVMAILLIIASLSICLIACNKGDAKINPEDCKEHHFEEEIISSQAAAIKVVKYTCSLCGYEYQESVEAHHTLDQNGKCTYCNTTINLDNLTLNNIIIESIEGVPYCGEYTTEESSISIYKSITSEELDMPIINLDGDISEVTKEITTTVGFSYTEEGKEVNCYSEIKVQGSTSAGFPKKNYTIKLVDENGKKNKVKLVKDWGKQSKYCLKANYVDYSQARNVVSGKLYGQIVQSRNIDDEFNDLVNGGAVDGYPVLVFNNGVYHGLYTLNIPKDKWLFDMDNSDEKDEAILMADSWNDSVFMNSKVSDDFVSSGWELEFYSNEESVDSSSKWVVDSFNALIDFVNNNDGQDFKDGISNYANVDRCIDSMIFTYVIAGGDNIAKNILWVTYDGTTWTSSVYDMDGTWGMVWNGDISISADTMTMSSVSANNLWNKLYSNYKDEIKNRYQELRQTVLSNENIEEEFTSFFDKIPNMVREAENGKWTDVPSQDTNNLAQIIQFAKDHLKAMDEVLLA